MPKRASGSQHWTNRALSPRAGIRPASPIRHAGHPEAAEDAYRKSLAIDVRLGDVAGQASTLLELGNLYKDDLRRYEEAAALYRQAANKRVETRDLAEEAKARSGIALAFQELRRLDEARQEIKKAIECGDTFGHTVAPWKFWAILADIETDAGNATAASEAKRHAIACYIAYRRDGGENYDTVGRIALAVTQSLLRGDRADAASLLQQLAAHPEVDGLRSFIQALQAIVAGSRDRALADAPETHYTIAAEILFLIETLEKHG